MTIGYLGIGLVLVIGIAIVVYGWLADRTDTKRRQDAMTQPPDRPIPGLPADAASPTYLSANDALQRSDHANTELTDAERATLKKRLAGAPSLPHGHSAPEFTTDAASGFCVLPSPWILVADHNLTTIRELLGFLERARGADRAVVVVAPHLDREVMATLQVNASQHTLGCAAVLMPDAGQRRALCSLVGAIPVPWEDLRAGYIPADSLGTCDTWVSSTNQLWLVGD